ncbi:hypothetical protein GCM10022255_001560 [Dactylosporangium darangshiense]|uniref:Type I restriction modification DNA specificity domain-containing protein n=1 Tax=Dactylosporangium darangshiense TaxID=579108 RepID=A0ABP8CTQ2_9ACTN
MTPTRGDLLYSREGTYFGIAAEVPQSTRVCLGQRMVLIRPNSETLDFRFLRHWLNSPLMARHISGFRDGSVAERLNLPTIRSLPVLVPPILEQHAIAEALGTLDDKIAVNERIAATSRALGIAQFDAACAAGSRNVTIGSISSMLLRGGAPSYTEDPAQTTVINQKCIRGGRVDLGPARKTVTAKVRLDRILQKGDMLVNSTGVGTLGRVAVWTHDITATCDSHVTIVRPNPAAIPVMVGAYAILAAQPEIELLGEGSTGQTELGRTKLEQLPVQVPVIEACEALASQLYRLEERSKAALDENQTLTELRDTLLPQLISGELRVEEKNSSA